MTVRLRTLATVLTVAGLSSVSAGLLGHARAEHNATGCNDIFGTASGEELIGGSGCDDIWGRAGNDTVRGRDGQDDLHGEEGGDFVEGEADHDNIYGGPGDDDLLGRYGNDHVQDENGAGGGLAEGDEACGNEGIDYINVRDGDIGDAFYNPGNNDGGAVDASTEEYQNVGCPIA